MKVFICGACRQAGKYRKAILKACEATDCEELCMERWGTYTSPPLEECLAKVRECDLLIFIWSPDLGSKVGDSGRSITELEYREAQSQDKEILALLPNFEDGATPYSLEEYTQVTLDSKALQDEISNLTSGHGCALFSSVKDVELEVFKRITQSLARRGELDDEASSEGVSRYLFGRYSLMKSRELVGRDEERELLKNWLLDDEFADTPVLAIVAYGGTGKSAVAWHWFDQHSSGEARIDTAIWFSFYETGATFSSFVLRVAAFIKECSLEEVEKDREKYGIGTLQEEVIEYLDSHRSIVVLDGLERILIGYHRLDAQRRDEAELDAATDNYFEAGKGTAKRDESGKDDFSMLSAGGEEADRLRRRALRDCEDTAAERFLRCLAQLNNDTGSRVLITTRLLPNCLQLGSECIAGVFGHEMKMLPTSDAAALLRSLGIQGPEDTLRSLADGCTGYALLLSKVAGRIKSDRPGDCDLGAWLANNPDFDPWSLQEDLVQMKHHVLEYSLSDIAKNHMEFLHRLAVQRGPLPMHVMLEELVGNGRVFSDTKRFNIAMRDLLDRNLLGYDFTTEQFDLHPLVRGRVWARMQKDERESAGSSLGKTLSKEYKRVRTDANPHEMLLVAERYFDALLVGNARIEAAKALDVIDGILRDIGDIGHLVEFYERFVSGAYLIDCHPEAKVAIRIVLNYGDVLLRGGLLNDAHSALEELSLEGALTENDHAELKEIIQFILRAQGFIADAVSVGLESLRHAPMSSLVDGNLLYLNYSLWMSDHSQAKNARAAFEVVGSEGNLSYLKAWIHYIEKDYSNCLECALEHKEWADSCSNPGGQVAADCIVGYARFLNGSVDEGIRNLQQTLRRARQLGLGWTEVLCAVYLAEAFLAQDKHSRCLRTLSEIMPLVERSNIREELTKIRFYQAKANLALGDQKAAEKLATEAYLMAWQKGPPFYYKTVLNQVKAWMKANEISIPADVPLRSDEEKQRIETLDFSVLNELVDLTQRRESYNRFAYSDFTNMDSDAIDQRLEKVKLLAEIHDLAGTTGDFWKEIERSVDKPERLRLVERLIARQATIFDLQKAYQFSNAKSIDANIHYLDYSALKQKEDTQKEGRSVPEVIEGDRFDPVDIGESDDEAWADYVNPTQQFIEAEMPKLLERIAWHETTGSAKKWWSTFMEENAGRPSLIFRLAASLAFLKSTIPEFFLAYVYSNTDNIKANLHYLRYSQIKKQEEQDIDIYRNDD